MKTRIYETKRGSWPIENSVVAATCTVWCTPTANPIRVLYCCEYKAAATKPEASKPPHLLI